MSAVTVSSNFKVTIPKDVRKSLNIRPGHRFQVINDEGVLELIPIKDIRSLRGSLKGLKTQVPRDKKSRT
jgi:AbrB family looped-hinge helix DNA binding protein